MRIIKPLSRATIVKAPCKEAKPWSSMDCVKFVKIRANGWEKMPVCAKFSVRLLDM